MSCIDFLQKLSNTFNIFEITICQSFQPVERCHLSESTIIASQPRKAKGVWFSDVLFNNIWWWIWLRQIWIVTRKSSWKDERIFHRPSESKNFAFFCLSRLFKPCIESQTDECIFMSVVGIPKKRVFLMVRPLRIKGYRVWYYFQAGFWHVQRSYGNAS